MCPGGIRRRLRLRVQRSLRRHGTRGQDQCKQADDRASCHCTYSTHVEQRIVAPALCPAAQHLWHYGLRCPDTVKPPTSVARQREIAPLRGDRISSRILRVGEGRSDRFQTANADMNDLNRFRD